MKYELVTTSASDTQKFAKEFAQKIQAGDIVTLSGELGAGKTTFVQGFAEGLGITQRIISPTFIIMRTYQANLESQSSKLNADSENIQIFYHIDLYRTTSERDLEGLGLKEIFADPRAVTVIEWPERLGKNLPKKKYEIRIENLDENKRKISINHISSSLF